MKSLHARIATAGLLLAVSLVAGREGLRLPAYKDVVGIWTICYGDTHDVKQGQVATKAECDDRLMTEILRVNSRIERCVTRPLAVGERAAVVSMAYNHGVSRICGSTLVKRLNAHDPKACDEISRWVCASVDDGEGDKTGQCANAPRFNKVFVKGLANRRVIERRVCYGGQP